MSKQIPLTWLSSYNALSPKTRVIFGVGLMINAGLALQFSDKIEGALGLKPTQQDEEKLNRALPRISTVERTPK